MIVTCFPLDPLDDCHLNSTIWIHRMIVRWFYSHCPQSSPAPPPAPGCLGLSFAARKGDHHDYYRLVRTIIIIWQKLWPLIPRDLLLLVTMVAVHILFQVLFLFSVLFQGCPMHPFITFCSMLAGSNGWGASTDMVPGPACWGQTWSFTSHPSWSFSVWLSWFSRWSSWLWCC